MGGRGGGWGMGGHLLLISVAPREQSQKVTNPPASHSIRPDHCRAVWLFPSHDTARLKDLSIARDPSGNFRRDTPLPSLVYFYFMISIRMSSIASKRCWKYAPELLI
jgi:hypothetical protein